MNYMIKNTKKSKNKIKYSLIFVLLLGLLSGIGYLSYRWCEFRNIFTIDNVDLAGCYILTKHEIMNKIDDQIKNKTLKEIDCEAIQNSIEELPYVKASNVVKQFPEDLKIQVMERIPLCYLITQDNNYILDANGVILPIPNNSLNTNLPLITGQELNTGLKYGERINSQKIREAISLFVNLKKNTKDIFPKISELNYQNHSREYCLYLNTNTKIYLGNQNLRNRLNVLINFIKQLPEDIEIANYQYLDLRWKAQIVCKTKNV